jgi:Ca2+-binding EF-hand superfamily protein
LLESESEMRRWLMKHGKKQFIDFTNKEIAQLHKYFQELDEDGSGSIGVEELEKPLISLGLCNNREEVQKIMDEVDEDGSGQIEFNEFLHIIKSASQKKKSR